MRHHWHSAQQLIFYRYYFLPDFCWQFNFTQLLVSYLSKDSFPSFFLSCPSKKWAGIECPGCGMQRSWYSLYKGSIKDSWHYNPGGIPFLLLLVFTLIHLKFKLQLGAKIIMWGFITTAALMWGNFALKLF